MDHGERQLQAWASSKTFRVGDSMVFEYNKDFDDVTEVTHNDFELCETSKPLARYQTGSDTINLTETGYQNFICGVPGHCKIGQKVQILVFPVSLSHFAAPVPTPVRSPGKSSSSPSPTVRNAPQYQIGPSPAPHSEASISIVLTGFSIFFLLSLFILG